MALDVGFNYTAALSSAIGVSNGYLLAGLVFVVSAVILKLFEVVVVAWLKALSKKTKNDIDDLAVSVIESIGWPFYFIVSVYLGLQFVEVPSILMNSVYFVLLLVGVFYAVKAVQSVITYGSNKLIRAKKKEDKDADTSIVLIFGQVLKAVVWVIAAIVFLSNLGYDVSAVAAGLGVGGLAIAFALQNVLADVFASVSIYFDKPFKVGDYIMIGTDSGTVKHIGIKTTRIQTTQGEELVVSNKELTGSRVRNFKKMEERRVSFAFGVEYGTPTKKLKKIPAMIKTIFGTQKLARLDRVHFKNFGDSSLDFEVVFHVKDSSYDKYMDLQQEVNLAIKDAFEKEKIEMAFPTRTVFLKK